MAQVGYDARMSIAQSLANKARWKKIPKADRSIKMAELASIKHAKTTAKQKRKHALKMRAVRTAKAQ